MPLSKIEKSEEGVTQSTLLSEQKVKALATSHIDNLLNIVLKFYLGKPAGIRGFTLGDVLRDKARELLGTLVMKKYKELHDDAQNNKKPPTNVHSARKAVATIVPNGFSKKLVAAIRDILPPPVKEPLVVVGESNQDLFPNPPIEVVEPTYDHSAVSEGCGLSPEELALLNFDFGGLSLSEKILLKELANDEKRDRKP